MIVALYARVSTEDQELRNQTTALNEMAHYRGYRIYETYTDKASGANGNRPGWKQLIKDAEKRRFERVLVVSISRVMRSVIELRATIDNLALYGVYIESGDIGLLDPHTATGGLMLNVLGGVAEWEREIIRERTLAGLEYRKRCGVQIGRPPKREVNLDLAARLIVAGHTRVEVAKKLGIPYYDLKNRRKLLNELIRKYRGGEFA